MAGFGQPKSGKNKKISFEPAKKVTADNLLQTAIQFHLKGDLANAEKCYREAIKNGYIHEVIYLNLGVICKGSGRPDEAIDLYKKTIKINPKSPDAYSNLGNLEREKGNYEQAIVYILKSLELKPDNPDAHMNLGGIYIDLGDFDQALAPTLKSLDLKPDNPAAYMNLGSVYKNLGNLDKALASTLKSLELKPDNPGALMNLGGIYKSLGDLDQALVSTLKSLELKPDNHIAHINLGAIYQDLGDLNQALSSTLKSVELKPDNPTAHRNLGAIYMDLGNLDQALASTLKSLELKPDNLASHMNLGTIFKDLGKDDQAFFHLNEALKSEELNEQASLVIAGLLYHKGKYRDAINAIDHLHSIESANLKLSLYLCLNDKTQFNQLANSLIKKRWINQQGTAAIDHSNVLYNQSLDNTLSGSTLDSISVYSIDRHEFPDALVNEMLNYLLSGSMQSRSQALVVNGFQSSGNVLDLPEKPFQALKELILKKLEDYNLSCHVNTDKNFKDNWAKNLYTLRGWSIVMNKGGNLRSHNHEKGWLTGTFYLQMPDEGSDLEEGAIEFSHQGPRYPAGSSSFKNKVIRPSVRDLNIFSSSLFHRTLPFHSSMQRICVAFDVLRNQKH